MNREERKRLTKGKITHKELKAILLKEREATYKVTQDIMLTFVLMTLRDKFGFGEVRAKRFKAHFEELVDSYNKDFLTLEDMKKALLEELKIKI